MKPRLTEQSARKSLAEFVLDIEDVKDPFIEGGYYYGNTGTVGVMH